NPDRVGLMLLFFIPAVWQVQIVKPTLFFDFLWDGCEDDTTLRQYRYKVGLDTGKAYHLTFGSHTSDDPYGSVVDRAARIAKLAGPDGVLASGDYVRAIGQEHYRSAGEFLMKGFTAPQKVFLRQPTKADENYLKPLLASLNEDNRRIEGYSRITRRFTGEFLQFLGTSRARPFIARELLNVPALAETPEKVDERLRGPNGSHEADLLTGYYIEWDVIFDSWEKKSDELEVKVELPKTKLYQKATIHVVPAMHEIVSKFTKSQRLRVRGIILEMFITTFHISYADFLEI
ncbi:MAG: hypothetical protein ACYDH9_03580, partial [Limisphaerales bacterium]